MLRELDDIGRETAVGAIRALEVELFGNHAWSEASIRQELDAPARVYVFDVDEADGRDTDREPAIRGFAGYWYDGDDAEIMDIGVSKTHRVVPPVRIPAHRTAQTVLPAGRHRRVCDGA